MNEMSLNHVLVADSGKSSLLMTTEILKDHFHGIKLSIARSGQEALNILKTETTLQGIILDAHLSDKNALDLALHIKKYFKIPILITAMPSKQIGDLIDQKCFAFEDCLNWIPKPVRSENTLHLIEKFFIHRHRTHRRIAASCPTFIQFKDPEKNKTKLRLLGVLKDLSLGGGKVSISSQFFFKTDEHLEVLNKLRSLPDTHQITFLFPTRSCLECQDTSTQIEIWLQVLMQVLRDMKILSHSHFCMNTQKELDFDRLIQNIQKRTAHPINQEPSQMLVGYLKWEAFESNETDSLQWVGGIEWSPESLPHAQAFFQSLYLSQSRIPSRFEIQQMAQNIYSVH